jgi:PPOX class probable F420-dependent enzyme
MPKPPLSENVIELLTRPNPAVIATVGPEGQPVCVATWYLWEDGQILVNMDESRKRVARLRTDPRATLTVLAAEGWHTYVSLQGKVTRMEDDVDLTDIDRLSQHYLGKPYWARDSKRISAWIEIERWHGWGEVKS